MHSCITLIIPVYNGDRFLKPLLDSVLTQTFPDWSCLAIDDGSTDESPAILADYAARDTRFTVVRQENAGCGVARNTALARVKTPYLMFADQDDLLHPQSFEIAHDVIVRAQVDCLCFGFERFREQPQFKTLGKDQTITPADRNGTKLITGRRTSWSIFVWRHIFRTEAVRNVPFPPVSGGEDQAWMSELSWKNLTWAKIEPALYFNREDPNSRSRGVSRRYVENVMASYDWIAERAKLYDIDPSWLRRYIGHMRLMFRLSVIYRRLRSLA